MVAINPTIRPLEFVLYVSNPKTNMAQEKEVRTPRQTLETSSRGMFLFEKRNRIANPNKQVSIPIINVDILATFK